MIIGLCGGSGSGKGTVCTIFDELGIPSIDTDLVYHDLTTNKSECLFEIEKAFGSSVVSGGVLDRAQLARIVFADGNADKLNLLNAIAHKHILAKTRRMISSLRSDGYAHVIVDAPLLFESGFDRECDVIIGVVADRNVRLSRIMNRDGIDLASAGRRIDAQLTDEEIVKRCDYVITNNCDIESLKIAVSKIYDDIFGGKNGKFNS